MTQAGNIFLSHHLGGGQEFYIRNRYIKPGFHLIARIAAIARIAQFCDQRSLRRNGNRLVQFAGDRCVASDPCVWDRKFSISAIAAILASKGSRLNMNFGLSFKRKASLLHFTLWNPEYPRWHHKERRRNYGVNNKKDIKKLWKFATRNSKNLPCKWVWNLANKIRVKKTKTNDLQWKKLSVHKYERNFRGLYKYLKLPVKWKLIYNGQSISASKNGKAW